MLGAGVGANLERVGGGAPDGAGGPPGAISLGQHGAAATGVGGLPVGADLERDPDKGSWAQPLLAQGMLPAPRPEDDKGTGEGTPLKLATHAAEPWTYRMLDHLAPSKVIKDWMNAGSSPDSNVARMPEAFQGMMGSPPGIMMSVPPGQPRDGGNILPPSFLAPTLNLLEPPQKP